MCMHINGVRVFIMCDVSDRGQWGQNRPLTCTDPFVCALVFSSFPAFRGDAVFLRLSYSDVITNRLWYNAVSLPLSRSLCGAWWSSSTPAASADIQVRDSADNWMLQIWFVSLCFLALFYSFCVSSYYLISVFLFKYVYSVFIVLLQLKPMNCGSRFSYEKDTVLWLLMRFMVHEKLRV